VPHESLPHGVATHHPWLVRGIEPESKAARLANYVITLRKDVLARAVRAVSHIQHSSPPINWNCWTVGLAPRPSPSSSDTAAVLDCPRDGLRGSASLDEGRSAGWHLPCRAIHFASRSPSEPGVADVSL
jgi:hypothetical protein